MNSKKINVAVVGCGMLAQAAHLPNIINNPRLHLRWCCDVNTETLKQAAEKFSPDKITTNPRDIASDKETHSVIICTHHNVRRDLIVLFADAGKHIYAEKPMANNMDEVRDICKAVKDSNVTFCIGHNRRCAPAIKEARRVYLKHKANPVNPAWRWDREGLKGPNNDWAKRTLVLLRVNDDALSWKKWCFEEGTLYGEMTHFVDLACYLTDLKPVAVTTIGDATTNFAINSINIEFEDHSLAIIATTNNGTFGYPKELVEIYYGGAAIVVDHCVELRVAGIINEPFWRTYPLDRDSLPYIHSDGGIQDYYRKTLALHQEVLEGKTTECIPPLPDKGWYQMLEEFIDASLEGKPGPSDVIASAVSTEVILKVVESANSGGKRVPINLDFIK